MSEDPSPNILNYGVAGAARLVTVASAGTEFEAGLIRARLDAGGVRSYAPNHASGALHPAMRGRGFPVQVEAADAALATDLLRDTPAASGPRPAAAASRCAACGHATATRPRAFLAPAAWAAMAAGVIVMIAFRSPAGGMLVTAGLLALLFQGPLRCAACNRPWVDRADDDTKDDDDDDDDHDHD